MEEFLEVYQTPLLQSLLVIFLVFLFRFLTVYFYDFSLNRISKKFGTDTHSGSLSWIRLILKNIWFVLGILAILYIFFDGDFQDNVKNKFWLAVFIAVVLIVTILISAMVNLWFKSKIHEFTVESRDVTNLKFIRYVGIFMVYFFGGLVILYSIPSMKGVATTALGGAGILTIVIGFASQEAVANIIGGIFIVAFKPFKVGDAILLSNGKEGVVTDITLRHIIIKDYDNKMIVIPNSVLNKEQIVNYDMNDKRICNRLELAISMESSAKKAMKIMQEVCESHPNIIDARTPEALEAEAPICRTAVTKIENGQLVVRVWAWANSLGESVQLKFEVLETIKERFDEEGIEMAYPYRAVLKTDKIKSDDNNNEVSNKK